MQVTLLDILAARQTVSRHFNPTPLLRSAALWELTGAAVHLKMECWQPTGSFKVRGALVKLASLSPQAVARGLVTASAGNHGLGVAYASQALGLPPVTIFVPHNAAASKVKHLSALPCELRRAGEDYDAAHAVAEAYARERGAVYLSAYDDPAVIAGQGTVGLEIMEDMPDADVLLVPVGGGGLIAGIAVAAKAINPAVQVIGVQSEASPSAYLSLRDGRAYETYPAGPTICDGLAGGFGRLPFEIAGSLIDGVQLAAEADIRRAVAWLLTHEQMIVEGSAAAAIVPLLTGKLNTHGRKVVAVLTGRNIDIVLLQQILAEHAEP